MVDSMDEEMAGWMDLWTFMPEYSVSCPRLPCRPPLVSSDVNRCSRGSRKRSRKRSEEDGRWDAYSQVRAEKPRTHPPPTAPSLRRLLNGCLFAGQDLRSVSAGFETDASAQNHFPGRSHPKLARQRSAAQSQAGGRRPAGETGLSQHICSVIVAVRCLM